MGVNLNGSLSELMTHFHSYKDFEGKNILMLGVQSVDMRGEDFIRYAQAVDFELSPIINDITNIVRFRKFDSYTLFKWMGFSDVKAMDVSEYEGADILWNLNDPIDVKYYGKFDYIYDGGTLEHIFDIKQAMGNFVKMLKVGGVIMHDGPAAKQCNHGFYTFSPTLFVDFYRSNGFRINTLRLFCRGENDEGLVQYSSVDCRLFDPLRMLSQKLDMLEEVSFVVCIATKEQESEIIKTPIQGMYIDIYNNGTELYKSALSYTVEWLSNKTYKNIAIYGLGLNACLLYDYLVETDKYDNIVLIRGVGDNDKIIDENMYRILSLDEMDKKTDCIVIGSVRYADLIEERLTKVETIKNIDIVNMMDI